MGNNEVESQLREIDRRFPQPRRNLRIAEAVGRSVSMFTGDKQKDAVVLRANIKADTRYDAPIREEILRDIDADANYVNALIEYASQHKAEMKRHFP